MNYEVYKGYHIKILSSEMEHYRAVPLPKEGSIWTIVYGDEDSIVCKPKGMTKDSESPLITIRTEALNKGFEFTDEFLNIMSHITFP